MGLETGSRACGEQGGDSGSAGGVRGQLRGCVDEGAIPIRCRGMEENIASLVTLLRTACTLKDKLFISGMFHLIFSNRGRPQVTETAENGTTNAGALL